MSYGITIYYFKELVREKQDLYSRKLEGQLEEEGKKRLVKVTGEGKAEEGLFCSEVR